MRGIVEVLSILCVYLLIILFVFVMWIVNIVKLTDLDFEAPYKAEVVRTIGIPVVFMPVVTGFMDIGEEKNQQ
jgi:hypothetical protein